jgi:hypothetical protein
MNGPHLRYLQALASDVASDVESYVARLRGKATWQGYVASDVEGDVASGV